MKKLIKTLQKYKPRTRPEGTYINGIYVNKHSVWTDALEREFNRAGYTRYF